MKNLKTMKVKKIPRAVGGRARTPHEKHLIEKYHEGVKSVNRNIRLYKNAFSLYRQIRDKNDRNYALYKTETRMYGERARPITHEEMVAREKLHVAETALHASRMGVDYLYDMICDSLKKRNGSWGGK